MKHLDSLKKQCDSAGYKAAVVDYVGFFDTDNFVIGKPVKKITESSDPKTRYGIRSAQHVSVYGFKVVYKNY